MVEPIYLDYAATTPVDPRVREAMLPFLGTEHGFGNPSSALHKHGRAAQRAVEEARSWLAALLKCQQAEVVFTSGATESNNTAIKGVCWERRDIGRHVVTMATEHKAVLEPCRALERDGFEVTRIRPSASGLLDLNHLRDALRADTVLVSIMHVNNETGVIQNIEEIARVVRESRAIFHVDAAQSAGKLPVAWDTSGIDLLSVSAHKFYGPKGIGALIRKRRPEAKLVPLIEGGGQELGLRAGTLPTHQIVGMGTAAQIAGERISADLSHVRNLRRAFLDELGTSSTVVLNADQEHVCPGIMSVSFLGIDAFALLNALPDVAASASSACTTGTLEPSHVLRAMGIEGDRLYGAVRFSFGRFTTIDEVRQAARRVRAESERLMSMASEPAA